MNQFTSESVEYDPFAQATVERVFPTSEAQREVWLADRLSEQASLSFNESVQLRCRGELDQGALRAALRGLLQRHEALRATVGPDGTELLIGAGEASEIATFDLRHLSHAERDEAIARAAQSAVETPFDLARGPLFRAALYRLADDEHVLLLTAHHIVCDGWSWGVMVEDLGGLYAEQLGLAPGLDDAQRYGDYVAWEAEQAAGPEMAEHERFWLGRYAGSSLPVLDLPADRPRAKLRTFNSRRIDVVLDADLVGRIKQLGAKSGASAFSTFYAGFAALLHRLTGQDDLVIGVPSAGQSASGMSALVGHCVNLLPVRTAVDSGESFGALLRRCSTALLDSYEHQAMTYGTLLTKLPVHRDPSRLPLVSVMFNIDQAVKSRFDGFPGLAVELVSNPRSCENFELFVNAAQFDGGLRLECQYNTDLFDAETVRRWLASYEELLRGAVAAPELPLGRLDWVGAEDKVALQALQPTRTWFARTELMHTAFERQANAEPDRVALRFGDEQLSYRELDERANRLAHTLRARGVQRGARVGVCLPRGPDMVVALLGILKSGAAYIPLDPSFPQARLDYYAEDAQIAVLVSASSVTTAPRRWCADAASRVVMLDTDSAWREASASSLATGPATALPEDPAYIIYTSGSTGKPKGVCVPHRAVVNFIESMKHEPGFDRDDRLAAVTTLSFDIAVLEILVPLSVGALVEIVSRECAMDGNLLAALLERTGATCMQATPGMWRLLIDAGWKGGPDFKALVGGEGLPLDLAEALLARTGELWNMYGPTETTVWSTVWRVDAASLASHGVSIGRPIANTTVWVLDEHMQPCPLGVPGEICIGGEGVTLGYLDRPELTDDRFVADSHSDRSGGRLYRTGDRGRWRNDGLLEHLGRLDFQVKVRGYRIELGEIEAACADHAAVSQCVVLAREDVPGDVRLVAYCALKTGASLDEAGLRAQLRARLPDYMVPQHIVVLGAIPLLPNGKIDRKALPAPEVGIATEHERVLPRNDMERRVLAEMELVLSLPGLSVDDDFFAMGGHSLLAARLTSRLNRDLQISLPLRSLFEAPTAAALAKVIEAVQAQSRPVRAPIRHLPGRSTAPLTAMQERILFVMQMYPDRAMYNTPSAHRLTGPMDVALFERALREMVRRQPALRTCIGPHPEHGGPVQHIVEDPDIALGHEDLSAITDREQREAELSRRTQAVFDSSMDMHRAPLFRACLYRLTAEEHAFMFMPHHVIWDGWSFDLLYDEMAAIYGAYVEGREPSIAPLEVTYGDYAEWHADWLKGAEAAAQIDYWRDRFKRAPAAKVPVPDRPRRAGMTGTGAVEGLTIDKGRTERLRALALDAGVTLNMVTMALYAAMVSSMIGDENVVIGVPMRGRQIAELEPVIGFFNNTLVTHLRLDPARTFADLARFVKSDLLELFEHQEVPFERLVVEPEIAARAQGTGLFQMLFSFQDARDRNRQWGNLRQQAIRVFPKDATQDVGMWLRDQPEGLYGAIVVNADIYDSDTGPTLHARYMELVDHLLARPTLTVGELIDAGKSAVAQRLSRLGRTVEPELAPATVKPASMVARTPTEQALAEVWGELLGLPAGGLDASDNFFDLGGNSLLAIQAVERVAARLNKRIQPSLYVYEALGQLAQAYDAEPAASVAMDGAGKPGLLGRLGGWLGRR